MALAGEISYFDSPVLFVGLSFLIHGCCLNAQILSEEVNQASTFSFPEIPEVNLDGIPAQKFPTCQTFDKRKGLCRSLENCALSYEDNPKLFEEPCRVSSSEDGVCCPLDQVTTSGTEVGDDSFNSLTASVLGLGNFGIGIGLVTPPAIPEVAIPQIQLNQLQEIAELSVQTLNERNTKIHDILFVKNITVPKGSPAARHQRFAESSDAVLELGNKAQLNIETTRNVLKIFSLSPLQGTHALPKFSLRGTIAEKACPAETTECDPNYPYRSVDGSCNNLLNFDWGKSLTPFQRLLAPVYANGVDSPRAQANGEPLPPARVISQRFMKDEDRPYKNLTLLVMQWGQFLDHDLTSAPNSRGENQTFIFCCTANGQQLEESLRHPDCYEIEIPTNDPFYSKFNQTCMSFVRTQAAPRRECSLGPREQVNQVTHFLDASSIYGSTKEKADSLREGVGGRLNVYTYNGREYMPPNREDCADENLGQYCFRGGDFRINEQVHLALMHNVWVREHNRLAQELQDLNQEWDDERIYQEVRRLVGAEIQHITFNEFLPILLGKDFMEAFSLYPSKSGHTTLYNPAIDPSVTNAFITAAYRCGHSMIQGILKLISSFGTERQIDVIETQFKPYHVYEYFSDLVRGLVTQESQRIDNFASEAVTTRLFDVDQGFGFDLVALNIQRGRDHGLRPFNDWREACGFQRLTSWNDFEKISDLIIAQTLSELYSSVDEIDLFIGGVSETPMPGSILGPTFLCIVGDGFARLRLGDRFFYEEITAGFTEDQLDQIRQVSLARVLCDNSEGLAVIQQNVLVKQGAGNNRYLCTSNMLPKLDSRFWAE